MTAPIRIEQAPFTGRDKLGEYMSVIRPGGIGVEVGTHRGKYAKVLLDTWDDCRLLCVDPWGHLEGYDDVLDRGDGVYVPERSLDRLKDWEDAQTLLKEYTSDQVRRCLLFRCTSLDAANNIVDPYDLVYLDGDHRKESIEADIAAWWPKVSGGGLLAGHDYDRPGYSLADFPWTDTVGPAVRAFAEREGLILYLVNESEDSPRSWFVVKP